MDYPPGKFQAKYKLKYLGLFSSISEARQAVQHTENIEAQTSDIPHDIDQRSQFKGVVRMKRGDYQLQSYDKNSGRMVYVERTSDPDVIAKFIAKKDKSTKNIKKTMQRHKTDLYTKACMIKRFGLCLRIYTNENGSLAVMSDLEASVDAMKSCPLLSVCCPALYYMSLLGKDGPWKECLSKHWSQAFDPDADSSSSNGTSLCIRSLQLVEPCDLTCDDLMVIARILQTSAVDAWKQNRKDWDLNVGKNKLYYMGWQRMVTAFGPRERIG